jgi:hypothetical protein
MSVCDVCGLECDACGCPDCPALVAATTPPRYVELEGHYVGKGGLNDA